MLHGPQRGAFDLSFRVPSALADELAAGRIDIGNIPVIEYARQGLDRVTGLGVACHGPVRSILLISKVPLDQIRTLAADTSSRTSVGLARILLARKYGVEPRVERHAPHLDTMLAHADAALIIGDPALAVDPAALPYLSVDLGAEWVEMTGLPMVFAVWAGASRHITREVIETLRDSCRYGLDHLDEVIREESRARSIPEDLARDYLTRHIVNWFDGREDEGLDLYLRYAREQRLLDDPVPVVRV